jgi:hypothetical protein
MYQERRNAAREDEHVEFFMGMEGGTLLLMLYSTFV